ncbi:MAG: hypothetical protein R6W82_00255 [bacterium]
MLSSAGDAEIQAVRETLGGRFGVSEEVLAGWRILSTGPTLWGVREHELLDDALQVFTVDRTSMPFLRRVGSYWKPTTVVLQLLAPHITRARVRLTADELDALVTDGGLPRTLPGLESGYVAVEGPAGVAGCGLYLEPRPEEDKPEGIILSQFPRDRWSGFRLSLQEEE